MLNKITPPSTPLLIEDLGMMFPNVNSKQKKRFGLYKCSCGKEFKTQISNIKDLITKSCGCHNTKSIINRNLRHGFKYHELYSVWYDMVQRTNNTKLKSYINYGGRGISVCERWLDIKNFIDDMYPTYQKGLSIDRINNDGNYELLNCRWSTNEVQIRNSRRIRSNNTSGYKGVVLHKKSGTWVSRIIVSGKSHSLGYYKYAIEAAKAYDKYIIDNNLEHTINGVL